MRFYFLAACCLLPAAAQAGALSISLDTTDFHASKSAASGPISSSDPDFVPGPYFPFPNGVASADYGQLKVASYSGIVPGVLFFAAATGETAKASFADSANFGAIDGVTGGTLTFSFTLDGSESGSASGMGISNGSFDFLLDVSQNGGSTGNFHAVRNRTTTAGGSVESATVAINGGAAAEVGVAGLFSTWTITVPFTAADGPLAFSASALCHSAYQGELPGPSDGGTCDAAHTITWGGVVASLNQNGQAFTGLNLIGSNGFNYALSYGQQLQAQAPEPASLALTGAGLLLTVGARRRRKKA